MKLVQMQRPSYSLLVISKCYRSSQLQVVSRLNHGCLSFPLPACLFSKRMGVRGDMTMTERGDYGLYTSNPCWPSSNRKKEPIQTISCHVSYARSRNKSPRFTYTKARRLVLEAGQGRRHAAPSFHATNSSVTRAIHLPVHRTVDGVTRNPSGHRER